MTPGRLFSHLQDRPRGPSRHPRKPLDRAPRPECRGLMGVLTRTLPTSTSGRHTCHSSDSGRSRVTAHTRRPSTSPSRGPSPPAWSRSPHGRQKPRTRLTPARQVCQDTSTQSDSRRGHYRDAPVPSDTGQGVLVVGRGGLGRPGVGNEQPLVPETVGRRLSPREEVPPGPDHSPSPVPHLDGRRTPGTPLFVTGAVHVLPEHPPSLQARPGRTPVGDVDEDTSETVGVLGPALRLGTTAPSVPVPWTLGVGGPRQGCPALPTSRPPHPSYSSAGTVSEGGPHGTHTSAPTAHPDPRETQIPTVPVRTDKEVHQEEPLVFVDAGHQFLLADVLDPDLARDKLAMVLLRVYDL